MACARSFAEAHGTSDITTKAGQWPSKSQLNRMRKKVRWMQAGRKLEHERMQAELKQVQIDNDDMKLKEVSKEIWHDCISDVDNEDDSWHDVEEVTCETTKDKVYDHATMCTQIKYHKEPKKRKVAKNHDRVGGLVGSLIGCGDVAKAKHVYEQYTEIHHATELTQIFAAKFQYHTISKKISERLIERRQEKFEIEQRMKIAKYSELTQFFVAKPQYHTVKSTLKIKLANLKAERREMIKSEQRCATEIMRKKYEKMMTKFTWPRYRTRKKYKKFLRRLDNVLESEQRCNVMLPQYQTWTEKIRMRKHQMFKSERRFATRADNKRKKYEKSKLRSTTVSSSSQWLAKLNMCSKRSAQLQQIVKMKPHQHAMPEVTKDESLQLACRRVLCFWMAQCS